MGRYNFSAQQVLRTADRLSDAIGTTSPPWRRAIETYPPAERLTRPPLQSAKRGRRKASRIFKPLAIEYPEDKLRATFFADHPWELARPRVILENDGKDHERQDWSAIEAPEPAQLVSRDLEPVQLKAHRPLSGESVVQRQHWLMEREGMSRNAAYDKARKEFYKLRDREELRQKVVVEEAEYYGADFGPTVLDIGMHLEDRTFSKWKTWATAQVLAQQQRSDATIYTGASGSNESDGDIAEDNEAEGTRTESK